MKNKMRIKADSEMSMTKIGEGVGIVYQNRDHFFIEIHFVIVCYLKE